MKISVVQNMVLVGLFMILPAAGYDHNAQPKEALWYRDICCVSKAIAVGAAGMYFYTANSSLGRKASLAVGGLASLAAIIGCYKLRRMLPVQARSLGSLFSYLVSGVWPGVSQQHNSPRAPQEGACRVDYVSTTGSNVLQDDTIVERTVPCDGLIHTLRTHTMASTNVRQGASNLVTLRAPRYIMEQLSERYDKGVLSLMTKGNCVVIGNPKMEYDIQTTDLAHLYQINHKGYGRLTLPTMGSYEADTQIVAEGSGDILVEKNIRGKNIVIQNTRSGKLTVKGSIEALTGTCSLSVGGSGDMVAGDVTSKNNLNITLSSSGYLTLNDVSSTHATIDLSLNGSGDFKAQRCNARGKATIQQTRSGKLTLTSLYAQSLAFTQSGSGDMFARSLTCDNAITFDKTASGGARVADSVSCQNFTIRQSGSGDTQCSGIIANSVNIDNSRSGSVTLSGSCDDGSVVSRGSGDCNLKNLRTKSPWKIEKSRSGRVITQ